LNISLASTLLPNDTADIQFSLHISLNLCIHYVTMAQCTTSCH